MSGVRGFTNWSQRRTGGRHAGDHCIITEIVLKSIVQVVMVPHHKVPKNYLLPATQVVATLEHFNPQDFGLPPFDDQ